MKKRKVTRRESREKLERFRLGCEMAKLIRHFFPNLLGLLRQVSDPRCQSHITYENCVLMMTRILSAIFYISSMRKTSAEFNSSTVIANIGVLCGEDLQELPYWETINRYLERIDPEELQNIVCALVRRLIRSRAFEQARIRDRDWQILIDGTQTFSSDEKLDGNFIFRVHNRNQDGEYVEYCYYVLEAKLVLRGNIVVSIMTEFVENKETEAEKQDCERKACYRLMKRLKEMFPRLPVCLCGDSLYACEPFVALCENFGWHYIVRYKVGSIPTLYKKYESLRSIESNLRKGIRNQCAYWYDFVNAIDYANHKVNFVAYGEDGTAYPFYFLTNLPVSHKNAVETVFYGRRRWAIENYGFNAQKKHGFFIEHLFSKNCQAMKNHYYLIQIAHMISQIMDAWKNLWEGISLSLEQKHRRMLESWKTDQLAKLMPYASSAFQIRFE